MWWLKTGAHQHYYSLNYDINYSFCQNSNAHNGLSAFAYGFPVNYNLNQITNDLFLWQNTFNYITIFLSINNLALQAIIIDYLA